ncbi:MAG: hypothetical protein KAR06_08375, partial [Deltaproteobacteria bacterium]|nr:hypothetical protein [Deltaproteobacteria bacterium]
SGLTPDFKVLDTAETVVFLKDNIFKLPLKRFAPLGNPSKHIASLVRFFSRLKDEDISADDYVAFAEGLKK